MEVTIGTVAVHAGTHAVKKVLARAEKRLSWYKEMCGKSDTDLLKPNLNTPSGTLDCVNKAIDTFKLVVEDEGKDTGGSMAGVAAPTGPTGFEQHKH